MRALLFACFALVALSTAALTYRPTEEIVWETNFEAAIKKAKKEKKKLFVNFTGSDWCGWCIRLDKEVFSKDAFVTYANQNFVCVKLDFPKRKQLPDEERKQNQELAVAYRVQGFPTILVLDTDKNIVMQTGYQFGGENVYIEHLEAGMKPAPAEKK